MPKDNAKAFDDTVPINIIHDATVKHIMKPMVTWSMA
jgi:hypothetical protein